MKVYFYIDEKRIDAKQVETIAYRMFHGVQRQLKVDKIVYSTRFRREPVVHVYLSYL